MKAKLTVSALLAICPLTLVNAQSTEVTADQSSASAQRELTEGQTAPQAINSSTQVAATAQEQADEALAKPQANITEASFEQSVQEDSQGFNPETLDSEDAFSPNAYNFVRPIPEEGDVYIPVLSDAKVFAEFIDELPAVVNFFTMASEDEIIAFYRDNYGEPVEQERKRGRLNLTYYLEDIATRVVISEQDNRRQVDVLQENAAL
ncbi:hypothetical protein [Thalassotalea euphylliae]|nr:hypothetical protein [Thalassotalea euphylliae]